MSRGVRTIPVLLLLVVLSGLAWRLIKPADPAVPSQLVNRPVPYFPPGAGAQARMDFGSDDLADGSPHLVNFFASWCVPCVSEVRVLQELKNRGVDIDGIAVRDRMEDVDEFLTRNGNPYAAISSDPQSETQIKFGSSGVPETFIVDGKGIIRYQYIGPLTEANVPGVLQHLKAVR